VEVVLIWSMLVWNDPLTPSTDRSAVTAIDNHYPSEDECRRNARSVIESRPKVRIACVQTMLAKAELESMKKLEEMARKALRDFPDDRKP